MIKIAFRKNHIYLVALFFSYFFRRILLIILQKIFGFKKSLIFCFFMCSGQIIGGITIYIYQYTFLRKKGNSSNTKYAVRLISNKREMNRVDNSYKFYKPKEIELGKYFISYILLILHFVFRSFNNVIEKYLGEYNFLSPFVIIFDEGVSTFILTSIYSIFRNPFKEVSDTYNKLETGKSIVFIILIILYFVSCAFVNVYKTYCNIFYSPMAKSLASYFFNSAFIIYHYAAGNDFFSNRQKNFFYFFINLIFSIIIDFFGLIYKEFFVLNFWNLSKETHQEIASRAIIKEMESMENHEEDNDSNDGDE